MLWKTLLKVLTRPDPQLQSLSQVFPVRAQATELLGLCSSCGKCHLLWLSINWSKDLNLGYTCTGQVPYPLICRTSHLESMGPNVWLFIWSGILSTGEIKRGESLSLPFLPSKSEQSLLPYF